MRNELDKMYMGSIGSGMSRSNIRDLLSKFADEDEKVIVIDAKSELQKEKQEVFYDHKSRKRTCV